MQFRRAGTSAAGTALLNRYPCPSVHPLAFRYANCTASSMPSAVVVKPNPFARPSIPQAKDILPKALKLDNIASYAADLADPAAVYNDPSRREQYLRMFGNICFDTRQNFINFPWSSERR